MENLTSSYSSFDCVASAIVQPIKISKAETLSNKLLDIYQEKNKGKNAYFNLMLTTCMYALLVIYSYLVIPIFGEWSSRFHMSLIYQKAIPK